MRKLFSRLFGSPKSKSFKYGEIRGGDMMLLQAFILIHKPKIIVESGTYRFASAIAMAEAIDRLGIDSKIYTFDINIPENINEVMSSPVGKYIEFIHDEASEGISKLDVSEIDFAFLDSTLNGKHTFNQTAKEFYAILPKASKSCIIIVHNTLLHLESGYNYVTKKYSNIIDEINKNDFHSIDLPPGKYSGAISIFQRKPQLKKCL